MLAPHPRHEETKVERFVTDRELTLSYFDGVNVRHHSITLPPGYTVERRVVEAPGHTDVLLIHRPRPSRAYMLGFREHKSPVWRPSDPDAAQLKPGDDVLVDGVYRATYLGIQDGGTPDATFVVELSELGYANGAGLWHDASMRMNVYTIQRDPEPQPAATTSTSTEGTPSIVEAVKMEPGSAAKDKRETTRRRTTEALEKLAKKPGDATAPQTPQESSGDRK